MGLLELLGLPPTKALAYSKERVTADFKHIAEIFKLSFGGMDEKQAGEIKASLKAIGGAVAGADLVGARNMMNKLQLLTGVGPDSPMQPIAIASKEAARGDGAAGGGDTEAQKKKLTEEFTGLSAELNQVIDRANPKNKQDLQALAKTFAARLKADDIPGSRGAMDELKSRLSEVVSSHEALDKARAARGGRMATLSRNIQKLMNELA